MEVNCRHFFSAFLHLLLRRVKIRKKVRYMRDNYSMFFSCSVWSLLALLRSQDAEKVRKEKGAEHKCESLQRSYQETVSHHQVTPHLKSQRCLELRGCALCSRKRDSRQHGWHPWQFTVSGHKTGTISAWLLLSLQTESNKLDLKSQGKS